MRCRLQKHLLKLCFYVLSGYGILQICFLLEPLFKTQKNLDSVFHISTIRNLEGVVNNTPTLANPCIHNQSKVLYKSHDQALKSPPVYQLLDDNKQYYTKGTIACFIEGTNLLLTAENGESCVCKQFWHGDDCSLPHSFIVSDIPKSYKITKRSKPRRLIYAFPFNIEFEMVEAMLSELNDIVDVFIVSESNYSAHGDPKPLRLLDKLETGFCSNIQHKIVYVYVDHFPKVAYKNGWIADNLPRDELGSRGLRDQIKGVRHDDIFILTDADEMPTREPLLFIKLHDGFPEPFGFHLHRTAFGFFWLSAKGDWPILAAVTVGMLNHVFDGKASKVRNTEGHLAEVKHKLSAYINAGGLVHLWKFGNNNFKTGWHCSWCFGIPEMQIKLISAINGDFPRWGDYPEKRNASYLRNMLINGKWFNGEPLAVHQSNARVPFAYRLYAPNHILKNSHKFSYLLKHPSG